MRIKGGAYDHTTKTKGRSAPLICKSMNNRAYTNKDFNNA